MRTYPLVAAAIAVMAVSAACATDDIAATPVPSASVPSASVPSASAPSARELRPLPACALLTSVVRQHFPAAVMGIQRPARKTPNLGLRGTCTAKTDLDDGSPLVMSIQLIRLEPAADGSSAEKRGLDGIQELVSSMCNGDPLIDGGARLPHTWSCPGRSDEIIPQAGATERGDTVTVTLISNATPTPGLLDELTATAAQLAHDLVEKVAQTR